MHAKHTITVFIVTTKDESCHVRSSKHTKCTGHMNKFVEIDAIIMMPIQLNMLIYPLCE